MPKQKSDTDEIPRRRRGAQAVAIAAGEERGFVMRVLLHSPKDTVACGLAVAAVLAIVANALFLQAGRHPSPMFGTVVALPPPAAAPVANPLPRPRPVDASPRAAAEPAPVEAKVEAKPADTAKLSDPMTNLVVKSTSPSAATSGVARPPAAIPSRAETTQTAGSKRVAAVQRALTARGYGQLKPTGTISAETQAAISRFERDRKLPVTGQVSDRVMRELAVVVGHPVE